MQRHTNDTIAHIFLIPHHSLTALNLLQLPFLASPLVRHLGDVKRKRVQLLLVGFAEAAMSGQRHDGRQPVVHVVDVLVGVGAEIHASGHAGEWTTR